MSPVMHYDISRRYDPLMVHFPAAITHPAMHSYMIQTVFHYEDSTNKH